MILIVEQKNRRLAALDINYKGRNNQTKTKPNRSLTY